ncbi:MAG: hypothetical protein ACM3L6_01425 [Deltaproteobacteria bacterium]
MKKTDCTVSLYRILGNDLPPRHKRGQHYDNAAFMLDHEGPLPHCRRHWIVNRIVDPKMERKIIRLLEARREPYLRIPFDLEEYAKSKGNRIPARIIAMNYVDRFLDTPAKREEWNRINYVTNINPARNLALREGRKNADWVIPIDAGCCFTPEGWRQIVEKLAAQRRRDKVFCVPTYRLSDNGEYFTFDRDRDRFTETEPMLIFGKETRMRFNEHLRYGMLVKIELIERLGFAKRRTHAGYVITDPRVKAGYNVRLSSGARGDSVTLKHRGRARGKGISLLIGKLDERCHARCR